MIARMAPTGVTTTVLRRPSPTGSRAGCAMTRRRWPASTPSRTAADSLCANDAAGSITVSTARQATVAGAIRSTAIDRPMASRSRIIASLACAGPARSIQARPPPATVCSGHRPGEGTTAGPRRTPDRSTRAQVAPDATPGGAAG
jgi:hypothetical protein